MQPIKTLTKWLQQQVTASTFAGGLPPDATETYAPVAEENPNHFELIGALGIAGLSANDTNLGATSDETDKLVNKDAWGTLSM
jgi:hypothetical protein